jgi:glycosyltransferase involved in cell wall biosynthesis
MKILLLANHLNYGGISAYCLGLAKTLAKKEGMEVFLGSRGGDLAKEAAEIGAQVIRLPLTTKCEVSPKVFWAAAQLIPFVQRQKIDVLHANTRVTQVLSSLVSLRTGVPYISTCHGYFKMRLSRRLFPCWGKKVIAISDQVREHLIYDFEVDSSRVELIYNGVEIERFGSHQREEIDAEIRRIGADPTKKIIGHIGRLSSIKGQKFLVLAAEELLQKRQDVQFLIIGDGEEKKNLEALIRQKGLEGKVLMRPSVKDTALALAAMDIFVMPSIQEGLGLSILEAQAQGVPVVASRVGGIPTVVEDRRTGLLCPAQDKGALASSILELLRDAALRRSLIQAAQAHVKERFSVTLMAEKTYEVYKSVVR